jgi:hypothetical protein
MMKKLSLSISSALMMAALMILPIAASAQDDKQAAFEREWYDVCYTKKDLSKCYELSKKLVAEFPNSQYKKNAVGVIDNKEINDLWQAYQAALQAFYTPPSDAAKLEKLWSTGDAFLARKASFSSVTAQQALAGTRAGVTEIYKDRAKIKAYVDKAMTAFAGTNTTDANDIKQEEWATYRDSVIAAGHTFLGFDIKESKGDNAAGIDQLTKSINIKNPKLYGIGGWKDPNNYYFRASLINNDYQAASAAYNALPDDQKTGDAGKDALKKVNAVVDRLIAEYARLTAVSSQPGYESYKAYAKENFDSLWKYRTDAPEKAPGYLQNYVADPTIADVEVPAKVETSAAPGAIPTAGSATGVKVAAGGAMPGAAPNGKNGKAAAPKGKPATKGKRKR